MRQYGEQLVAGAGPKQPGRKCLSRTQMSEPYELSQNLLDKQLEMLGSSYGGLGAANTIQRAYRRYSMMKKLTAITSAAQGKMENRRSGTQGVPGHTSNTFYYTAEFAATTPGVLSRNIATNDIIYSIL